MPSPINLIYASGCSVARYRASMGCWRSEVRIFSSRLFSIHRVPIGSGRSEVRIFSSRREKSKAFSRKSEGFFMRHRVPIGLGSSEVRIFSSRREKSRAFSHKSEKERAPVQDSEKIVFTQRLCLFHFPQLFGLIHDFSYSPNGLATKSKKLFILHEQLSPKNYN